MAAAQLDTSTADVPRVARARRCLSQGPSTTLRPGGCVPRPATRGCRPATPNTPARPTKCATARTHEAQRPAQWVPKHPRTPTKRTTTVSRRSRRFQKSTRIVDSMARRHELSCPAPNRQAVVRRASNEARQALNGSRGTAEHDSGHAGWHYVRGEQGNRVWPVQDARPPLRVLIMIYRAPTPLCIERVRFRGDRMRFKNQSKARFHCARIRSDPLACHTAPRTTRATRRMTFLDTCGCVRTFTTRRKRVLTICF